MSDLPDGIYFDLDDQIYHGIRRLSASGITKMMISPATYWAQSWMNPDRAAADEDTPARVLGRAYHTARLEPEKFEGQFIRDLVKEDMPPHALTTSTEYGEALAAMGAAKKKAGETVLEQAERLCAAGYGKPIWHLARAQFEADLDGRTPLAPQYFDQLREDMHRLHSVPEVMEHLTGGEAEVSVLWTCPDTKLPMKARIDYLKPTGNSDLKTFQNSQGKEVRQAIRDAFQYNRYYIQAALYLGAFELIRSGALPIQGEPSDAQIDLVAKIRKRQEPGECWYVFQEKGQAPNIFAEQIMLMAPHDSAEINASGATDEERARARRMMTDKSVLMRKAEIEIHHAQKEFIKHMEIFGEAEPWTPIRPVGKISDDDFSPYWLDNVPG